MALWTRDKPDSSDLVVKAIQVAQAEKAQAPNILREFPARQRQSISELADAIKAGANWAPPGTSSGTVAQLARARPVSAQQLAQQAHASLNPNSGVTPVDIEIAMREQGIDWVQPFAPGSPLTPYYGYNRRPRERNYDTGRNITTDTRPGRIPFATIKQLIESYDVASICYRHAIQDLRSMRIRFEVMEGYEQNAVKEITQAKEFLRRPDKKVDPATGKVIKGTGMTFRNWLCKHATDVWRYDCGTIYRQRDRAGNVISLPVADGTLFAPMLDYFGANPSGDAPAFQQFIQGIPWDWLRWEDLIYEPMWPHTEDPYGVAPIETVLVNANTDIRLQAYFLQFFTTGTVPEAFAIAPEDQSDPDALAEWQETYNDWTYGDQSERWGLRWLPHGTELDFYKPQQFDPDVAEYVMRRTVAAFMMVPHDLGFTADVNRASGETQMDTQFRINSLPHVAYYEDILDAVLQDDLSLPVQVRFDTGREKEDRLMEAQAHQIYVSIGSESPDEVRDKVLGYPINPEEKVPRFFDSQRLGPIPISYLLATAGDVDPLTGAPRPGTVERRDIVLPGTPGPNPPDQPVTAQYDQAKQHDAEAGRSLDKPHKTPKEKGVTSQAPQPPLASATVLPFADQHQSSSVAPDPRTGHGKTSARRVSRQAKAATRTLKAATAGIGISTGIAGGAVMATDHPEDKRTKDDDEDLEVRQDLTKWRTQSRSRVAKGTAPREFLDSAIPDTTYADVWNVLKDARTREEVDAAFMLSTTLKSADKKPPVVAGIALLAQDTSRVLMVRRGNKDDDEDGGGSSWEFPGGHLDPGETAVDAAMREWTEETGATFPKDAKQVGTWVTDNGKFQGYVYTTASEDKIELGNLHGPEIVASSWWDIDDLDDDAVRDKVTETLDRIEPILDQAEKAEAALALKELQTEVEQLAEVRERLRQVQNGE